MRCPKLAFTCDHLRVLLHQSMGYHRSVSVRPFLLLSLFAVINIHRHVDYNLFFLWNVKFSIGSIVAVLKMIPTHDLLLMIKILHQSKIHEALVLYLNCHPSVFMFVFGIDDLLFGSVRLPHNITSLSSILIRFQTHRGRPLAETVETVIDSCIQRNDFNDLW